MPAFSHLDLWMNILAWSSFLILTGAVVGQLTTRLKTEVEQVRALNRNLEDSQARIEVADRELRDHAENLEEKVLERTERPGEIKGSCRRAEEEGGGCPLLDYGCLGRQADHREKASHREKKSEHSVFRFERFHPVFRGEKT